MTPTTFRLIPRKPCFHDDIQAANEGSIYGTEVARQPLRNQNRKRHSCCLCDPDANNNIACQTLTGRGSSGHQSTDLLCLNLTEEQFQRLFFSSTYASHPLVESSKQDTFKVTKPHDLHTAVLRSFCNFVIKLKTLLSNI